jgi:hypothetical protein
MLKHIRSVTAVATLVTAIGLAGTASAQAPLGLSINPTHGIRGDVVNAQVNTDDIAANCATTTAQVQAAFAEAYSYLGMESTIQVYFPNFPDQEAIPAQNYEQLSYIYLFLITLGIDVNQNGAADIALENSHVLTFADLVTQEPQGQISTFDQTTGMGSVVVPDITPGVWAVAAACVVPAINELPDPMDKNAVIQATIDAMAPILQADGRSLNLDDPDLLQYLADHAVQFLQPFVTPAALGVQLFTIETPTLGFTIDPTQGFPGDTVNGQVDTDDIDQYCVTDQQEFQDSFQALLEGPFAGGAEEGELFDTFFPGGTFVFENTNQLAYSMTGISVLGIAANFGGAADTAFPQTFVMTFADLLTQQPLGPLGHFDPMTGVGSVVVPDLTPAVYPVAATCVRPTLDLNLLIAGIEASGAFLTSIGAPPDPNTPEFEQFVKDYLGDPNADLFTFIFAVGPTLIQNIVTPAALGVQFYTVLAHVNHFQCYRARTTGFTSLPITLADRFGTRSVTVRKPVDLCAPADKNGEDPEAPDSPFFLTSYKISGSGPFTQIAPVHAENQFGPIALKIKKPKTILVPTGVTTNGPPSSPDGAFLNHFTCYKARAVSPPNTPTPGVITVQTAFETVQVQPKKPKRLCVPAHKNGGPVVASEPENLLCYKAKSSGRLTPAPVVFLANQFGDQTQRLGPRREICIPTDLLE